MHANLGFRSSQGCNMRPDPTLIFYQVIKNNITNAELHYHIFSCRTKHKPMLEGLRLVFHLKNRYLLQAGVTCMTAASVSREREQSEACGTVYIAAVSSPQSTPFTQVIMWSSVNAKTHSKAAVSTLAEVVISTVWTKRSWLIVWNIFFFLSSCCLNPPEGF